MKEARNHRAVAIEMMAAQRDDVAKLRAGLAFRGKHERRQRRVWRGEIRLRVDAAIVLAAAQNRQRRSGRAVALDEHDRNLIGRRGTVLGLEHRPELGHVVAGQRLRNDAYAFDLIEEIVGRRRWTAGCGDGRLDVRGAEHGMVVKNTHGAAEKAVAERLGGVVAQAVGREQVIEIQRQRRLSGLAWLDLARHVGVAERGVDRRVVQKKVDVICVGGRNEKVRRLHRDRRPGNLVADGVIEQVAQSDGDGGDGQRVTHRRPLPSRRRR